MLSLKLQCKKFSLSADILSFSMMTLREWEKMMWLEDHIYVHSKFFQIILQMQVGFFKKPGEQFGTQWMVSGSSHFTNNPNCLQAFISMTSDNGRWSKWCSKMWRIQTAIISYKYSLRNHQNSGIRVGIHKRWWFGRETNRGIDIQFTLRNRKKINNNIYENVLKAHYKWFRMDKYVGRQGGQGNNKYFIVGRQQKQNTSGKANTPPMVCLHWKSYKDMYKYEGIRSSEWCNAKMTTAILFFLFSSKID